MKLELSSLVFVFAFLCGCTQPRSPDAAFEHATQTFRRGQLSAAAEEAERGYEAFHGVSAEWAWKFRLLEANILLWRGLSSRTLTLITSETLPPPSTDLAIQKVRLEGSANLGLGHLPEAEQKFAQAELLCRSSDAPSCATVSFAEGALEMQKGHFKPAQLLFEQSLAAARSQRDDFVAANVLLSLGWSALQQEHFDEAVDWSQSSYQIAGAHQFEDLAQNALGNLGWACYKLGEPERAERLFVEAIDRATKLGDVVDQVKWQTTIGYVFLDAQDYTAAERSYQHALDLAKQINSREDIVDALMSLALVSERRGNIDQARAYADQSIALAPANGDRLEVLYPMLIKGHVAARRHDTRLAEKTFREVEQDPKSHVFLKWEAERSLAQLYEEEKKPALADQEYRLALNAFETARSSLKHEESSLPFPANAAGIYDDYIHFLVSGGKIAEALQVAEYSRGRTLAEGLGLLQKGTTFKPDALNPQAMARKAGGTIFFYWLGEKQSYLWAITPEKTNLFRLPPKSAIGETVQRYRKALAYQQEFLQSTDADGRELYRILVAPAQALLPKDPRVFIIPDGSLNALNFETLLVADPTPHYWIEDVTLVDASSLHLLAASQPATKHAATLLLLGNAVAPNADYPELRNAFAEIESIEKHFPLSQQAVFVGDQATPAAYLTSQPGQFSYLHFVAHGTASRTSPLDSAIVLSPSGTQDDSFKLYARDIIRQPLHADLVTISTCYGAGARAYTGEGLVGLSWAFLRAGAHNVIGALWEVSDVSTPQLMDELYQGLQNGKNPDAALRAAKLSLLHSGSAFSKPFYWAPFQLYTGS